MLRNRRRKRIGSTTKLSIPRDSMRPYIKEIEKLRAENYRLKQSKSPISPKMRKSENSTETDTILEFKIQLDHKIHECSRLIERNKSLENEIDAQRTDNLKIANETARFKAEKETELENVYLAKKLLSDSLQELITDYRYLEENFKQQELSFAEKENMMRKELEDLKSSCKEGIIKIAETAKNEIERLLLENHRQKTLLNETLNSKDN